MRALWHPTAPFPCPHSASATDESAFGDSGWGARASQKLGIVRGKDFRHEKTKMKRGSYRGGAIDMDARNSFKFDSESE